MATILLSLVGHSGDTHCLKKAGESQSAFATEGAKHSDNTQSHDQHFCHVGHCVFVASDKISTTIQPVSKSFIPPVQNFVLQSEVSDLLRPPRV